MPSFDSLTKWTLFKAFHTCKSSHSSNGSRLDLIVPANKTGSCGIIVKALLRSSRPILLIFMPSISILPSLASMNLKKATAKVLLPAPVRPTIPIFSLGNTVKVNCFKTGGKAGEY
eukprot:NODE_246_length_11841_cov_1.234032.p7 type:complete len:116 gc:universal NODE_246_length_11841_cov_1.234032:10932-11279(+)